MAKLSEKALRKHDAARDIWRRYEKMGAGQAGHVHRAPRAHSSRLRYVRPKYC
jgi:hypothetical protein